MTGAAVGDAVGEGAAVGCVVGEAGAGDVADTGVAVGRAVGVSAVDSRVGGTAVVDEAGAGEVGTGELWAGNGVALTTTGVIAEVGSAGPGRTVVQAVDVNSTRVAAANHLLMRHSPAILSNLPTAFHRLLLLL